MKLALNSSVRNEKFRLRQLLIIINLIIFLVLGNLMENLVAIQLQKCVQIFQCHTYVCAHFWDLAGMGRRPDEV